MGACGSRPCSRREPEPRRLFGLQQGFYASALLTVWTGELFVREAVLCIVVCLTAFLDVSIAPAVATKNATYCPKFPKARSPLVLNHWPRRTVSPCRRQISYLSILVCSLNAGTPYTPPLSAGRDRYRLLMS